jgi:hypothetical protein
MRGAGRWIAVVVAVSSVSTGIAIAGGGKSKTRPVTAEFEAKRVKNKQKQCDAKHVRAQLRFEGTLTSDDPRFTGDLVINATSVVNTKNGWGRTEGDVVVTKTYHPGSTFRGEFIGVVEPDGGVEGFIVGETKGRHSVHLFANFNADQNPDGSITGEFGKDSQEQKPYAPPEHQDPAVVTNACFKHHDHGGGHGHGGHPAKR